MSQTVNVDRALVFKADAAIQNNVKGNLSTERMHSVDWFDGKALDTSNAYTQTLGGTSDAGALTAGGENGVKFTTGTGDNEISFLATGLVFDITQKPDIESKIEITDVSGTVVFFGFSDAVTESTPAGSLDADSGTLTAVATDVVGFVVDADLGTSSLYCASAKSGASVQSVDTGIDWTDTQSKVLRVSLDASGNARFYVDGVQEGYIASAVADVPLCAIWNYGTRANDGANVVTARYLKKWQDIP
tara:strand:- start:58 stop:795 length:738 start_codon:yes stop_codon:yes gene_type:complete